VPNSLIRFPDWESRLVQFFSDKMHIPFQIGVNDCALFACDAVLAITGVDLALSVRGLYSTQEEGHVLINEAVGDSGPVAFYSMVAEEHGIREVPILFARRGDCVMITLESGMALGIVGMDGVWACFAGPDGLERVLTRECSKAWRIG